MRTNEETIKGFRNENLFSKEDLLASFRAYMEYVEEGEEGEIPDRITKRRIELCQMFLEKMEACKLPVLTELWWFYEYLFTDDGIELNLCTADDVESDENGDLTWSTSVEHTMIKQDCNLLTVEEFARDWGIEPVTVRQWIRRGKLRTAKKIGRDWFIPELQDKPERGFRSANYIIDQPNSLEIPQYPLVSVCNRLVIFQDENDRKNFAVALINDKTEFREEMTLNRKEVEALEYALISSGKTSQGSHIQLVPWFERKGE